MIHINIQNFVFTPYKIKSHFLVHVTFSFSIKETKNIDVTGTNNVDEKFYKY